VSRATHAILCRFFADHIESVGKQRLQQSGKYRVNTNDEEISRVPVVTRRTITLGIVDKANGPCFARPVQSAKAMT
jgi:hypothetical protein